MLQLLPPCSTGVTLCITTTGGESITAGTENVAFTGEELIDREGGVTQVDGADLYTGTDEIGFPMTGVGAEMGEGGLLFLESTTFTGLCEFGRTRRGDVSLF